MPVHNKIGLLICFVPLLHFPVNAQLKLEKPVVISKDNGLPVNDIRNIRKDDEGFLWIATSEGLCRFDGQLVKTYKEGSDLRYSLLENGVNNVLPVKNKIWMVTGQGVSVLNKYDNTFRHYQFDGFKKADTLKKKFDQVIWGLHKDSQGTIWIGTRNRGVCMYDEANDSFRFFTFPREKYPALVPALGNDYAVINIESSKTNDSLIWAGTSAGLQEINKFSGEVKLYTFPQKDKDYQIALNVFRRLYHHADNGLLYVGSYAAGVNVFNPDTKTFTPLKMTSEEGKKMLTSPISNISRKSDHELWITSSVGLMLYDINLKDITWSKVNNVVKNEYYAMSFIDEANRVWLFDINGLQYFDPAMQQFTRYSFEHLSGPKWNFAFYIISDKTGNDITVCTRFSDGLYHLDRIKKQWDKIPFPSNENFNTEFDAIRGFEKLKTGEYILSNDKGLFVFSAKNHSMKKVNTKLAKSRTRRTEILKDHKDNIWFCDESYGLIRWNPQSGEYVIYNNEYTKTLLGSSLGRFNNLYEDHQGNIWSQVSNGIAVYSPSRDTLYTFDYKSYEGNSFPSVVCFSEDKMGRVWVSSIDGWVGYTLSKEPEKGVVYKTNLKAKGIPGNLTLLATDLNGNVWGYTTKELVKIAAENLAFTTYSFDYGVTEPDFFHFSILPTGEMIFGGRNEITIANPAEFRRNSELPVPYVDEIEVMNKPYNFKKDGTALRLRYNQNFFSIGFSALAYTLSKGVKYRYRLQGFDDWTEVTGRHFANYTNVPGGKYVFQLQAANNEGIWNKNILELPVRLSTAFWQTWWFNVAVLILVAFGVYWLYRYRVGQLKKKEKLKSEYEKKLANVEMSALLAQMNPHFLFNSLNSIDSYIIRNESKKASEYLNNFARLMRLILQNSRSNYISFKDELEALELYLQMESLRFKNKFSYSISVDERLDTSTIVIPPMLIQPYVENAIWHGLMHKTNGEEGKVDVKLYKNEDNLLCVISDNGIGRKKAAEIKANKSNNHKRSMGMQITEDRIEIINKLYNINASVHIYDIENEQGEAKGTKVELNIPV